VTAGAGMAGGQEDALGAIFCESMKYIIFNVLF